MDVGGNLVVASKQDTSDSKSSNWSAGGTATVGAGASLAADAVQLVDLNPTATGDSASVGMGKGSGSSAWVNNQTSIIGKEQVDIRVEKNTHVEGAVIAAENGNLKLDTDTLTYKDIHDHDKASNYQASLSVSKSAENAQNSEKKKRTPCYRPGIAKCKPPCRDIDRAVFYLSFGLFREGERKNQARTGIAIPPLKIMYSTQPYTGNPLK